MSAPRKTEIVDAETLSAGARVLAPNGVIWLVSGEPEEDGELITLRMTPADANAPAAARTVHRTTKYEVLCA